MEQIIKLTIYAKTFLKRILREPQLLLNPYYIISRIKKYGQIENYGAYLKKNSISSSDIIKMQAAVNDFCIRPTISTIILQGKGSKEITISSLDAQVYSFIDIKFSPVCDLHGLKREISEVEGEYLALIKSGDRLYPNTFFDLVSCLNKRDRSLPDIIFSDHDYYEGKHRFNPFFKPGWSPDLLFVNNYISRAFLIKREELLNVICEDNIEDIDAAIYELLLKVAANGKVSHEPGILFSFSKEDTNNKQAEEDVRALIIIKRENNAIVSKNKYGATSILRKIEHEPFVSIIIPTCFKEDYIFSCLKSIFSKTKYKNYEVLVLDNSKQKPDYGQKRLKDYDCRVINVDKPFNWAQFNNIAAFHAKGELYLFLNDDTDIITGDWLEKLSSQALRPEIGVVGPLLLFPDGVVQHAGMFLVNNSVGIRHCFAHLPESYTGYHNMLHYQRNVIAVSGACQMVSKQKFEEVGGFDERFSVGGNDVDFCLRIGEKGYYNLFLPEVIVTHKEKASRANMSEEYDNNMFKDRWGLLLAQGDPFFNKNLSSEHSDFRIKT